MSQGFFLYSESKASPVSKVFTIYPSFFKNIDTISRISFSSSAKYIVAIKQYASYSLFL